MPFVQFRSYVASLKVFAAFLIINASAQAVPLPGIDKTDAEQQGFYGNPNEPEERIERAEAYRRWYEKELAGESGDGKVFNQIFAPRVYDELFETDLPSRQVEGRWRIRLSPKFSDFVREDLVRFPIGLAYAFSNWFEAYSDFGTYFRNPFKNGSGSGLYNWRLGTKYSWINVAKSDFSIATGINANIPLSNPPPSLIDGYARYTPFVSISHHLRKYPDWVVYLNLAYELVDDSPFRASPVSPQPADRQFVRPGIIHYPGGNFRYSLELEYRTNVMDFRNTADAIDTIPNPLPEDSHYENWILASEDVHEFIIHPAITWFPTRKLREGLVIPGNWDIGLQLDLPIVEETNEKIGLTVRFRWYYEYRKLITQDLRRLLERNR